MHRSLLAVLVASLVAFHCSLAVAQPAASPSAGPPWAEVAAVLPGGASDVVLEKVEFEVTADDAGQVVVAARYFLSNATEKTRRVKLLQPTAYSFEAEELGGALSVAPSTPKIEVTVKGKSTPLAADAVNPAMVEAGSGFGRGAEGVAFTVSVPRFETAEVVVTTAVPWGAVAQPKWFPSEKGFSISLEGLSAWGDDVQAVKVSARFSPALLGPAAKAGPRPYAYDSKGLSWSFDRPGTGELRLPARVYVRVFSEWAKRPFRGVYFARYEIAEDDAYPWDERFQYINPVTISASGKKMIRKETVSQLIRDLDETQLIILARNGKAFDDTFAQMRFQKEPWYKVDHGFSEDRIKPVEKWNLTYARCQARAARTMFSALEKMKKDEVPARGRSFKFLIKSVKSCDERFWNPTPAKKERPLLR